jgi:arginase family enzyme
VAESLHIDFDGAWNARDLPLPTLDARKWGPQLRFSAPVRLIENFYREHESKLTPFLVYGSGDFHHLTALWVRRVARPIVLVSFDNHPDWDVRPPKWGCGGWINRALELPHLRRANVWGCGNFECWWPRQIFGNRRAEREGKLSVHPWADDRPEKDRKRRGAILRENWRERFTNFTQNLKGSDLYVTIDLDCLNADEAVTNWENGRFKIEDLVWALGRLREVARIIAGDICGAFSEPVYARRKQRFAGGMDHPDLGPRDFAEAQRTNRAAFEALWPALTQ